MDQLATLVALKRRADSIDGLSAYIATLYRTAAEWTDGGTPIGTAALCFDSLVDRIAHQETPATGTHAAQQPVERSHTPEPDANTAAQDRTPQTGSYGPERLNT